MNWSAPSFWLFPILVSLVLGGLALLMSHHRLRGVYERHFRESNRERGFLAASGFFVAVLIVRLLTTAIHMHIGPFHDISMRGRHIHHLVWGILGLLVTGYLWLLGIGTGAEESPRWLARLACLLYGVSAALTLDEFALWFNLRDVYWEREGRESFEALGLFGALLTLGILGRSFFSGLGHELMRMAGRENTRKNR